MVPPASDFSACHYLCIFTPPFSVFLLCHKQRDVSDRIHGQQTEILSHIR